MLDLRYQVVLAPGGDEKAPGGAVTVALCGHWDHPAPCRWPHRTSATRDGEVLALTVEVTCDASEETEVRRLVDSAIASGAQADPEGRVTRWSVATAATD